MASSSPLLLPALLLLILTLVLELSPVTSANPITRSIPFPPDKTYSVHQSCYHKEPRFDTIVNEVFKYARRADQRTQNAAQNQDRDWMKTFQLLVGVDVESTELFEATEEWQMEWLDYGEWTAKGHVHRTLGDIGSGWQKVDSGSEVRIYCDNMKRWIPHTHSPGLYEDPDNQMLMDVKCAPPDAPEDSGDVIEAATCILQSWSSTSGTEPDPNPYRSTIDICDLSFDVLEGHRTYQDLEYDPAQPDKEYLDIEQLQWGVDDTMIKTVTRTLLHEWTHTRRYSLDDHPSAGRSGGWDVITSLDDPQNAVNDAELMAYLGHFAWLADHRPRNPDTKKPEDRGGYVMDRDVDNMPAEEYLTGKVVKAYPDVVP